MRARRAATALRGRCVSTLGQPTPDSHPHLLRPGETTPGVAAAEYAHRRAALAALLPPRGLALLAAAPVVKFSGTAIPIPSLYRQDASLFYLTGVTQPGVVALLERDRGLTLVVPPAARQDDHARWWGPRLRAGSDAAAFFGAATEEHSALPTLLAAALARSGGSLCTDLPGLSDELPPGGAPRLAALALRQAAGTAGSPQPRHTPLAPLLARLRFVKSPAEAALMRASARLCVGGLAAAAGAAVPGAIVAAAAAAHEAHCRAGGAQRLAFPTVCGPGAAGVAIHQHRQDWAVGGSDAMLMDAGCELHGYCSDVTRTWPVARRFSSPQRALYDAVRSAHAACLAAAKPGASLASLHGIAVRELAASVAQLRLAGAAEADAAALVRSGGYFRYFPHALGHSLGLDTHDGALLPSTTPLQPGCVITIEPGLYVAPGDAAAPPPFRGLGVRIEDDVLITESGYEVLSGDAPVDALAVEEWAAEAREDARAAAGDRAARRRARLGLA